MSLEIIRRPAEYSGALSPIVYQLQRKDFTWNSITNQGGDILIHITGIDLTSEFDTQDTVYVKSDDGVYDRVAVCQGSSWTGAETRITVNIPYISDATNGFINNNTNRQLYQAVINLYDKTTYDSLLEASLNYSPNSKGVVTVDVRLLKSLISPEIESIAALHQSTVDENKLIEFFIGFTEQWVGSSETESLDEYFPINAIFGTMPILGKNDYQQRVPERFITNLFRLAKYFDVSFLADEVGMIVAIQWTRDDVLLDSEFIESDGIGVTRVPVRTVEEADEAIVRLLSEGEIVGNADSQWSEAIGSWIRTTDTMSTTDPTATIQTVITASNLTVVKIRFVVTITGVWLGTVSLTARVVNTSGNSIGVPTNLGDAASGSLFFRKNFTGNVANQLFEVSFYVNESLDVLGDPVSKILFERTSALNSGTANMSIQIFPSDIVSYENEYVLGTREIEIKERCKRPVTLSWCNEQGGQEWWTFDYTQLLAYTYGDGRKVRRVNLYEGDVSLEQWKYLNTLNTIGEIYKRNIVELSSDVRGTHKRIDSQVYVLLDNLQLLEVVVIPIDNSTMTKKEQHNIEIQIELPEDYEQDNFYLEFSGDEKRFVSTLIVDNPNPLNISWRVKWFGSIPIDLVTETNTASSIISLPLPENPGDITIVIQKLNNNGIAQNDGTITFAKDGVSVPSLAITFDAGDDMSEVTVVMPSVTAAALYPNDRINVSINEQS